MRLPWLVIFLFGAGILKSPASDPTGNAHKSIPNNTSARGAELIRRYPLITGTDRGGELMIVSSPEGLARRIRVEVGLSNSDLIKELFYNENRLAEVRETRRTYSYNEKAGIIDFTKIRSTATTLYRLTDQSPPSEGTTKEEPSPKDIQMPLLEESNFFLRLLEKQTSPAELDIEQQLKQNIWR